MTKTYCPLPWIHFSANTDSSMRVCCNTGNGGFIKKNTGEKWYLADVKDLKEYYNTEQLSKIRLDMINNVRPEICERCFHLEDQGANSVRQTMIKFYPFESVVPDNTNMTTGEILDPNVIYLDFSWGNKCNLKCKMC